MQVIRSKEEMVAFTRALDEPLTLVPTMGALHAGHASLIRFGARACPKASCVVSIFVNPTQFNDPRDLAAYPDTFDADLATCEAAGIDTVFAPRAEEMYASDASVTVVESRLSQMWEGGSRPGHFAGVCTVLAKLFHLTRPGRVVLGEKDWQQLAIVRQMVRDLDFHDLELLVHPTVRESDGLALSSRNARLSPAAREQAYGLFAALCSLSGAAIADTSVDDVLERGLAALGDVDGFELDYLAVVDQNSLEPLPGNAAASQPGSRALLAGVLDGVRLIDNLAIG